MTRVQHVAEWLKSKNIPVTFTAELKTERDGEIVISGSWAHPDLYLQVGPTYLVLVRRCREPGKLEYDVRLNTASQRMTGKQMLDLIDMELLKG